jgi:hypothetical protein
MLLRFSSIFYVRVLINFEVLVFIIDDEFIHYVNYSAISTNFYGYEHINISSLQLVLQYIKSDNKISVLFY